MGFYCVIDEEKNIGVAKKLEQLIGAAGGLGLRPLRRIYRPGGLRPHLRMMAAMLRDESHIIYYRLYPQFPLGVLLAFVFVIARLIGKRVVVDIPTPIHIVKEELSLSAKSEGARKWGELVFLHLNIPLLLLPVHKVIQYAPTSRRWQAGLAGKAVLAANGIDVSSFPVVQSPSSSGTEQLKIAVVSSLAEWHGIDRVIRGISDYYSLPGDAKAIDVTLTVIGDGRCAPELRQLASVLGVSDRIRFLGPLTGQALDDALTGHHVAVGTLAGYRIGMSYGSPLKHREYAARGLPFLIGCDDPDFDPTPRFVLRVKNDDSAIDIKEVIQWRASLESLPDLSSVVRKYAERKLDFSVKARMILLA